MQLDFEESKYTYLKEAEIRVKMPVNETLISKFRDVLRKSQQIKTEFKNFMQDKIKWQLKIKKRVTTKEELDRLARDPEATQTVMRERLIRPANKKI